MYARDQTIRLGQRSAYGLRVTAQRGTLGGDALKQSAAPNVQLT
jgi:hypothetical protein